MKTFAPRAFTPEALYTRNIWNQKLLWTNQRAFTPDNFYARIWAHPQTSSTQELLRQMAFTPAPFAPEIFAPETWHQRTFEGDPLVQNTKRRRGSWSSGVQKTKRRRWPAQPCELRNAKRRCRPAWPCVPQSFPKYCVATEHCILQSSTPNYIARQTILYKVLPRCVKRQDYNVLLGMTKHYSGLFGRESAALETLKSSSVTDQDNGQVTTLFSPNRHGGMKQMTQGPGVHGA